MRKTRIGSALTPDSKISPVVTEQLGTGFDSATFLAKAGVGSAGVNLKKRDIVFSQGDRVDAVFYIQKRHVELTVVAQNRKKAIIAQLNMRDFIGEECVAPDHPRYMTTATALSECTVLRINGKEILRSLHEQPEFSSRFVPYLLARGARLEADIAE
jgi:CRP-like cAMP-binding protein